MDATDPDLPDAAVEHISHMLTLAKSKHQDAMALLGKPERNAYLGCVRCCGANNSPHGKVMP